MCFSRKYITNWLGRGNREFRWYLSWKKKEKQKHIKTIPSNRNWDKMLRLWVQGNFKHLNWFKWNAKESQEHNNLLDYKCLNEKWT